MPRNETVMNIQLHKNAATTPKTRAAIQASGLSNEALAEKYSVHRHTVAKWKGRDDQQDKSHCPETLNTTLDPLEEIIVVTLRKTVLLGLDDLLFVTRKYINPKASRAGVHRLLKREGISRLADLYPKEEGEERPKKTFKDYDPGYIHIDLKYLPKMPDQDSRSYLFVAIDRATRWVYMDVMDDKTAASAEKFLQAVLANAPFKIEKVLTDNGKEFTDKYCATGKREPTGKHLFDKVCNKNDIEHRLTKPRTPQTNGMVERFNGRIAKILHETRFYSIDGLKQAMRKYEKLYNHHIPQKNIGHISPVEALKKWKKKKPELFTKNVYKQARPDIYPTTFETVNLGRILTDVTQPPLYGV